MRLTDRLSFARARSATPSGEPAPMRDPAAGFELQTYRVCSGHDPSAVVGPGLQALPVPDRARASRGLATLDPLGPSSSSSSCEGPPLLVLDLETSGLFGNAIPFIVGIAWHDAPDAVTIHQWTLREPGSERAMLADVMRRVDAALHVQTRLLTFNGASFDLPVLRARLQRLRLDGAWLQRRHLDLLHPARRLWRGRFADCRLATLEAEILGVRRIGDIDGAAIAELFDRLVSHPGDAWLQDELRLAQAHNRADLLGLLALTAAAGDRIERPRALHEALGSAHHLAARDRADAAIERISRAVQAELTEPTNAEATLREAMLLWAELERRRGGREQAARLWRSVCRRWPGDLRAHEALAKHLEHQERRLDEALEVAAGSACPCPRRLARLRRKLARAGAGGDRSQSM